MQQEIKTAIVILNWNGEAYLQKFLPVLLKNTPDEGVSIVVADNASTDGSVVLIQQKFPAVKIVLLDKNYGFAGGYNRALSQIEADFYLLLNSDVEVTPGWLNPMLDYLIHNHDVAACQPKILSYQQRDCFEHAGAAGGYIDFLGYPFCRGRMLAIVEKDEGQYNSIQDVFWTSGACMLIRAKLFHETGGFDDRFFAHMEEIDLCWRLRSRSFRLVCVPESKIYHVGGGTLHVEHPRKTYLNFRNNLFLLFKNLPSEKLISILTIRFFLDYIAAFQLFITGKPKNALAVLRARNDFRKMKKDFLPQRNENLVRQSLHQIPEIFSGSIILNYYFEGRKKYSQLK